MIPTPDPYLSLVAFFLIAGSTVLSAVTCWQWMLCVDRLRLRARAIRGRIHLFAALATAAMSIGIVLLSIGIVLLSIGIVLPQYSEVTKQTPSDPPGTDLDQLLAHIPDIQTLERRHAELLESIRESNSLRATHEDQLQFLQETLLDILGKDVAQLLARIPDIETQERRHTELLELIRESNSLRPIRENQLQRLEGTATVPLVLLLGGLTGMAVILGTAFLAATGWSRATLVVGSAGVIFLVGTVGLVRFDSISVVEKLETTLFSFTFQIRDRTQQPPPETAPVRVAPRVSWVCESDLLIGPFVSGSSTELESKDELSIAVTGVSSRVRHLLVDRDAALIAVIGATDSQPLSLDLRRTFDSNVALAKARATEVEKLLQVSLGDPFIPSLTLVSGPKHTKLLQGQDPGSLNELRRSDRVVKICLALS